MALSEEEIRQVLARAEELDQATRQGLERKTEVAALVAAAEEVGFSRQALERALVERLNLPLTPPSVGALAWAPAADGRFHVAEVLSTAEDGARVRFLSGSEHNVPPDVLRPCTLIPNERVACDWPMWGPWTCTVIAYDAATRRVKLNDGWGYTRTFPLAEVWPAPPAAATGQSRRGVYTLFLAAAAAAGAVVGSLLTLWLAG